MIVTVLLAILLLSAWVYVEIFYQEPLVGISCASDVDCNFDSEGNCAGIPYNENNMIYDHPGCSCKAGECQEAYCEPPCELG